MAAKRYLQLAATGFAEEVAATVASAGAGDDGKIVALDASGKLDSTVMPAGVGSDSKTMTAGENLSAGNLVYISSADGKVYKADATNSAKFAVGFVLAAITANATGTVYFEGSITGLSSLTAGTTYFLSASTAGAVSATVPTTAGHIVQYIGVATSTTEVTFEPNDPIKRA
jgi:hypothetical protein